MFRAQSTSGPRIAAAEEEEGGGLIARVAQLWTKEY